MDKLARIAQAKNAALEPVCFLQADVDLQYEHDQQPDGSEPVQCPGDPRCELFLIENMGLELDNRRQDQPGCGVDAGRESCQIAEDALVVAMFSNSSGNAQGLIRRPGPENKTVHSH